MLSALIPVNLTEPVKSTHTAATPGLRWMGSREINRRKRTISEAKGLHNMGNRTPCHGQLIPNVNR